MNSHIFERKKKPKDQEGRLLQEATEHGAFVCTKERDVENAGAVYKLRDPCSDKIFFVFVDEAEQFSSSYATAEEAEIMSKKYAENLLA